MEMDMFIKSVIFGDTHTHTHKNLENVTVLNFSKEALPMAVPSSPV